MRNEIELPEEVDVVVIGGGIVGLASALFLARNGARVLVVEKGRLGGEQSERAFGWISNLGLDPRKLDMTARAKTLWQQIDAESGGAAAYSRCGIVFACGSDRETAQWRGWLDEVAPYPSVDARLLDAEQTARLLPAAASPPTASLFGPSDGRIEPEKAVAAVASLARKAGALIVEDCAVRGLRLDGSRVVGIDTEHGMVRCNNALVAAGAWSRLFCAHHGIRLPQLSIESSLLRTTPVSGAPDVCLQSAGANFRPCADGSYVVAPDHGHIADIVPASFPLAKVFLPALWATRGLLKVRFGRRFFEEAARSSRWRHDAPSPFERYRNDTPAPDERLMKATLATLRKVFPVFDGAGIAKIWAGRIDATPDSTPVISAVASHPGLWIATGFSGYGLTHAPAAGEAVAAAIAGNPLPFDLSPYRLSRFFDGTRLTVRE